MSNAEQVCSRPCSWVHPSLHSRRRVVYTHPLLHRASPPQWFRIIDKDRSGSLDVFELQNALALGKINFSLKTVQSVMRLYDADGNGKMGLPEYHRLHSFLSNVTLAFRRYDTDNSGNLDQAEVKIALRDAGFNLDDPAFIALFKSFDPDKYVCWLCRNGMAGWAPVTRTSTLFMPWPTPMSMDPLTPLPHLVAGPTRCA